MVDIVVYSRTFILVCLNNHFVNIGNRFLNFNIQHQFFSGSQIEIVDTQGFIPYEPNTELNPAGLYVFKPEVTAFIGNGSLNRAGTRNIDCSPGQADFGLFVENGSLNSLDYFLRLHFGIAKEKDQKQYLCNLYNFHSWRYIETG